MAHLLPLSHHLPLADISNQPQPHSQIAHRTVLQAASARCLEPHLAGSLLTLLVETAINLQNWVLAWALPLTSY